MPSLPRTVILGYATPSRPDKDIPDLPWDLGEITSDQLARLYSQFVQWANYLNVQVAEAEANEEAAQAKVNKVEALFMARQADAGVKLNDARAARDIDEGVLEARQEYQVARHVRKLTATLLGNCERSAAACSREQTRRQTINPHERRSD